MNVSLHSWSNCVPWHTRQWDILLPLQLPPQVISEMELHAPFNIKGDKNPTFITLTLVCVALLRSEGLLTTKHFLATVYTYRLKVEKIKKQLSCHWAHKAQENLKYWGCPASACVFAKQVVYFSHLYLSLYNWIGSKSVNVYIRV